MTKRDDWPKTRKSNTIFNSQEVAIVNKGFRDGIPVKDIARQLGCSSKTIYDRYKKLRGGVRQHHSEKKALEEKRIEKVKFDPTSRFYKSNFEL